MHSNGKILFLDKKIVYQSFYDAPLTFSSFSSRKISVFRHASASRLRSVHCLKVLVEKMISPVLFDTNHSFKQYNALLSTKGLFAALVKLFFLQGKVCVLPCVGKSLARCLSFEAFRRPCGKNDISAFIWHKLFKWLFIKFYGALLTLNNFFFK